MTDSNLQVDNSYCNDAENATDNIVSEKSVREDKPPDSSGKVILAAKTNPTNINHSVLKSNQRITIP